jgi:hypothetical protein
LLLGVLGDGGSLAGAVIIEGSNVKVEEVRERIKNGEGWA